MRGSAPTCRMPSDWVSDPSLCWFEWQALVGSILAIIVGGATIWYIRKQIKQAADLAERQNRASLEVARAKLPIASSATASHAKLCIAALDAIEPSIRERRRAGPQVSMPLFPPSAEAVFDRFLGATNDENGLFAVAAIYAENQVLGSRMNDLHLDPRSHALAIDDYFLQPIIVHALAMSLLTYGRRETDVIARIGWEDVQSSARTLLRNAATRDRILSKIADKIAHSKPLTFALSDLR